MSLVTSFGKSFSLQRISKRLVSNLYQIQSRSGYHSYPDPDEKPQITQTKSTTQKQLDKTQIQLDKKFSFSEVFPGTPKNQGLDTTVLPKTFQTKLSNGLTVASQDLPGLMTSFACILRAGSAYEKQEGNNANIGTAHFLELCAFKSTKSKTQLELITEIEKMGGVVQCIATRENIIYCIDVLRENTVPAFQLFADSILNPSFTDEELDEARMIVQLQQEELPSEVFSRDLVQRAAYLGSPLGNHHFCPVDQVNNVTAKQLHDFRKEYYVGENIVLAGAAIEHNEFLSLAEKYFHSVSKQQNSEILRPVSKYTGGKLIHHRNLKEPNIVKIAMAFDCGGWKGGDSIIAICVLQQLLGGGSSFSAGGPGKGMFSRLYTQVLNRYMWAESIESFVSIHEDHGIFGIDAAVPPTNIPHMIRTIVNQITEVATKPITKIELSRAKNMLKSMMMMQLESRLVVCEDIARQIATFGYREDPINVCKKIDAITEQDIMNVGIRLLSQPPSIAVVGPDLSHVPSYEDIKLFTQSYYEESKKNRV